MSHLSYVRLRLAIGDQTLIESGIVAELLLDQGADSFQEHEDGLDAYFELTRYNEEAVREALSSLPQVSMGHVERIAPQNWNALWESTVTPVRVKAAGLLVQVHSSFHTPDPTADIRIVVDPKMAFGTGHHATTAMMMAYVLEHAPRASTCLDMGCGSGILAILAARLGTPHVLAIDNDPWACSNAADNVAQNAVQGVTVSMGDFSTIPQQSFDLVLANLTRNLLHHHMETLARRLGQGGLLAISGFYSADSPMLLQQAGHFGLELLGQREQEGWAALLLQRSR